MYKLCRTEQSANRQRQLENGLLEVMKTKRFEEISVSDLCDHIGIPRKSFYRYFSSKEGALYALLDHTLLEFYQDDAGKHSGTALGDLERFFGFWYERKYLIGVLFDSNLSGLLVERATTLAQKEHLMPAHIRRQTDTVQEMAITFTVCGLIAMVFQWHQSGYRLTPGEMVQAAKAMLTKPLLGGDAIRI